jgi:hypothetical protein
LNLNYDSEEAENVKAKATSEKRLFVMRLKKLQVTPRGMYVPDIEFTWVKIFICSSYVIKEKLKYQVHWGQ